MKQNAAEMQHSLINLDLPDSPWQDRNSAPQEPSSAEPGDQLSSFILRRSLRSNGLLFEHAMQLSFRAILRSLRPAAMAFLAPIAVMSSLLLSSQPAMAMVSHPFFTTTPIATMSNKIDAAAKDAEGKLESAVGDLTGDKGHQIKGKAKQVQASAMNAAEDVKEGARSAGKKMADATGQK